MVHAHPSHVVILSATDRKLETFNPSSISFRGGVPVLGSQLIYKAEDGIEIAQALGGGKAVILKNYGAVTIGRTVAEAMVTMFLLERAAESIYSKRSEEQKTACQRKPMALLALSSNERRP